MKNYRIVVVVCMVSILILTACGTANSVDSTNQADQPAKEISTDHPIASSTAVALDATPATSATWEVINFRNKLDTFDSYTMTYFETQIIDIIPDMTSSDLDLIDRYNLSLAGATATQSSEFINTTDTTVKYPASNAIDGTTDSFNQTDNDSFSLISPWLQIDLGSSKDINNVVITNRTDCCQERLTGAILFLSDTPLTNNTTLAETKKATPLWRNIGCNDQSASCTTLNASPVTGTVCAGDVESRYCSQIGGTLTVTFPAGTKARYILVRNPSVVEPGYNNSNNSLNVAEIAINKTTCEETNSCPANNVDATPIGGAKKSTTFWQWQQKVINNPVAMETRFNSGPIEMFNEADIKSFDPIVQIASKLYSFMNTATAPNNGPNEPKQCIIGNDTDWSIASANYISYTIASKYQTNDGNPWVMQKTSAGPDVLGHATDVYEYTETKADGSTHQSKVLVERNDGYAMRWETIYKTKDGDALGSSKYELSDINAVAPITVPKECENVSSEDSSEDKWLIPDGAQIYMQTYDSFVLITDKSGKELTDFYTTTMKDAGYALESSNDGLEIDGYDVFIQLLFKKEDKTIEVNISEENSLRIQYLRQSRRLVDCVAVH